MNKVMKCMNVSVVFPALLATLAQPALSYGRGEDAKVLHTQGMAIPGEKLDAFSSQQQTGKVTLSGVVTDHTGSPLIGVSLQIKGQAAGAITDVDGKFAFSAPVNSTIVDLILDIRRRRSM